MTEEKANYDTKFSHNEKVYIKKGFYKNNIARVTDVNKNKEGEYNYNITIIKETIKNEKKIETEMQKIKVQQHMLIKYNNNPLTKMLMKIFGV